MKKFVLIIFTLIVSITASAGEGVLVQDPACRIYLGDHPEYQEVKEVVSINGNLYAYTEKYGEVEVSGATGRMSVYMDEINRGAAPIVFIGQYAKKAHLGLIIATLTNYSGQAIYCGPHYLMALE